MASIFNRVGGSISYRGNTYKRIFMALSYGAGPKVLAKRYGWRVVREVTSSTLKHLSPTPLNAPNIVHSIDSNLSVIDWRGRNYG